MILLCMNNKTIDYTLICNGKQEIVSSFGVSVMKRLSLDLFSLSKAEISCPLSVL